MSATTEDLAPMIDDARARLDSFERRAMSGNLLSRLRRYSPFHPLLIARALAIAGTLLTVFLAIAALAAPLFYRPLAVEMSRLDSALGQPLPAVLGLLVFLGFVTALGAHLAARAAGRSAPLLPHEAKHHQRLISDLKQLEAKASVKRRMTPPPGTPRLRAV